MAESENEVILKQLEHAPFSGEGGNALNLFLAGLKTFGYNFSELCDTLIQFFTTTKAFLEAFKNPLTGPLLETIDSLIEALEEMNNLGFGNVNVWPWEHGVYPPQVDTSKLDESILGLVAAMEGLAPEQVGLHEQGQRFIKTKNGETLLTPDQKFLSSIGTAKQFQTKELIYDTLLGIRNFFNIATWAGSQTPFYADSESLTGQALDATKRELESAIKFTQDKLIVKELTPQQCVDKIRKSLQAGGSDSSKPTGSGPYKAYMLMFALPTINSVIQVVQSFVDYFGDVIGDELLQQFARQASGIYDEKEITISLGEPLTKYTINLNRTPANASEWFHEQGDYTPKRLPDGTYKLGNRKVNMFKSGDRIIQEGGILGLNNFSAEVVEHFPIVVENGMILQNKVRVKGCRGEYVNISQKCLNSSTVPVVRAIASENTLPTQLAIFRSETLEKPTERPDNSFWATFRNGRPVLTDIIPNTVLGQDIRRSCQTEGDYKNGLEVVLGGDDSERVVSAYVNLISQLKKGMLVDHNFLRVGDLSDSDFAKGQWFKDTPFTFNYGKIAELVPDLGVNWRLAEIKIEDDGELKDVVNMGALTRYDLFQYPDPLDTGKTTSRPIGIKPLHLILGFLNYDGSWDTDMSFHFANVDLGSTIDVPGGAVYAWETKINESPNVPVQCYVDGGNSTPNWRYITISDLFPVYGSTIQESIGMVKKFRKMVTGLIGTLDEFIKALERNIKSIERLNNQIQQLIAFFTKGLNGTGLYSAQFSGQGVREFRKQLRNVKMLQTSPNRVNEISLDTIDQEVVIKDPFTGLDRTEKRKQVRPSIKQQTIEPDGIPKPLTELDNLSYSGAIVFFAQGPDIDKFDTFMNNFNGLATIGKGFLANLLGTDSTVANQICPRVHDIQGQNSDGNFESIESLGAIDSEGTIRIIITNEADGLNKKDRDNVHNQAERSVDFSPNIQTNSIVLSNFDDNSAHTKNDSIILFNGTFDDEEDTFSADSTFHQFKPQPKTSLVGSSSADKDGNFEKQFFNIDLVPKNPLKRTKDKYKIVVKSSIINREGQSLKSRYTLETGFSIKPVTVESGRLI